MARFGGTRRSAGTAPLRRRLLAGGLAALLVVLVGMVVRQVAGVGSHSAGSSPTAAVSTPQPSGATGQPVGATGWASSPGKRHLGPAGAESSVIEAENALPGSSDWQISASAAAGPTVSVGSISGWADHTYAQVGQSVRLYVTTTAPQFTVTAYRMGFYAGAGARRVWASPALTGLVQPPCPITAGTNMISCDTWSPSVTMAVTADYVQGDYLLKLVSSTGAQSYVVLTVWDPSSHATYLFETHSLTEQGWNTYGGGFDFYAGTGPCAAGVPSYPQCNRARVVSFDRPYADGHGSADFLYNEYPLLRFMEQRGLDLAYTSDIALDHDPGVMLQHTAFLSLGHDETWTYAARRGLDAAAARGVNIAFMSAAAIVRHARLQPSPIGPDRQEVDYRNAVEDPLGITGDPHQVTGNTWESPPTSWPTLPLIGEAYSGFLYPNAPSADFVVNDATAWIYRGTGLHNGSVLPAVIGSDFDHLAPQGTPPNLQVIGHSPVPLSHAFAGGATWGGVTYSDMTYYTRPGSNAGVFDSGAVSWIDALTPCPSAVTGCAAPQVQQMTANLLWLFGQGPAGTIVPSTSNQATLAPPRS